MVKFKLIYEDGREYDADMETLNITPGTKTIFCVNLKDCTLESRDLFCTNLKQCLDSIGVKDYVLVPCNGEIGTIKKIDL